MTSLGPFELTGVIGQGGMGQIWHGRHRKQDVEVAIKVILPERVAGELQARLFNREVLATATLNHHGIIGVYDYGLLSENAQDESGGELTAGSPYLVMEYATGGSLWDRRRPRSWARLKSVLLQILDGLAHAHAHELIHRDLKPGNVLVAEEGGHSELKLADFGLAYVGTPIDFCPETESDVGSAGTPAYMAPEQIRGRWRQIGPWTDLYALGCMAFELACGEVPFARSTAMATYLAQIDEEPPPLKASMSVPPGFSAWVRRLLEKAPRQRFRCAADAAWTLARLDDGWSPSEKPGSVALAVDDDPPEGSLTRIYGDSTAFDDGLEAAFLETLEFDLDEVAGDADVDNGEHRDIGRLHRVKPPMPRSWEAAQLPQRIALAGVGLGLYGMRRIGLVGRREERDRIWQALREVSDEGRPKAVVLRGPSGCGKSAIAEWMARRAVELGAGRLMQIQIGPAVSIDDILGAAMRHFFRTEKLSLTEATARIEEQIAVLDPDGQFRLDAAALASMAAAASGDADTALDSSTGRRELAVLRLLRCLSVERPVVLWIDDIHRSSDAIALVELILRGRPAAILCLLTVRDSALTERPVERRQIQKLHQMEGVRPLKCEPLPMRDHRRLIGRLLPLEAAFIDQVARRTAGNPHFAVELLRDWIDEGHLILERGYFRPPRDGETVLPDSLHQVWTQRLDGIFERFEGDRRQARRALELAACFGRFAEGTREWVLACKFAGIEVDPRFLQAALEERVLSVDSDHNAEFSHEMIRESILRLAEEAGRLQEHHRICVQVLRHCYGDDDPEATERRCRHLVGAGMAEEAVEPLLALATRYAEHYDYHRGMRCGMEAERALDSLQAADDDRRRIRAWVALGWNQQHTNPELATDYIARIRRHARLPRDMDSLAETERLQGSIAADQSKLKEAEVHYEQAMSYFQTLGDELGEARVNQMLGFLRQYTGDYERARQHFEEALESFTRFDSTIRIATVLKGLGDVAMGMGDYQRAREHFERALRYARRSSEERVMAISGDLGDATRYLGDLAAAEALYQNSYEFYVDRGSTMANTLGLNLSIVHINRGQYDEAAKLAKSIAASMKRQEFTLFIGAAYLLLCCAAAGAKKRAEWDEYFPLARRKLSNEPVIERDIGWACEEAARLAEEAGWSDDADVARTLSIPIWQALGDEEALTRVKKASPAPTR